MDQNADVGPLSFTAYQAILSGRPWTQFLQGFLANRSTLQHTDQGTQKFEMYLIWDTVAVRRGADLDVWVLEPNGNLYIPYLGTVTPNGVLSPESFGRNLFYEGWLTNRFVQNGVYKIYADLWTDPLNHRPVTDIAFRNGQTDSFATLYGDRGNALPKLSRATSWRNDPQPTFAKIESGAYTDLVWMAQVRFGGTAGNIVSATAETQTAARSIVTQPALTGPQLATVRQLIAARPRTRMASSIVAPPGLRPATVKEPN
jgi:hypothetical protein